MTGILLRMTGTDAKAERHDYLQGTREVLLWKLEGLSEYNVRRPLTPTGTNLLNLVKHAATGELEYFGRRGDPAPHPRAHDSRHQVEQAARAAAGR